MSISVRNLSKEYQVYNKEEGIRGSLKALFKREYIIKKAVKDISFTIDEGDIVGFIGPNGAGKTTTIKMMSGLLHPTKGKISILNEHPWKRSLYFKKKISIIMGSKPQLIQELPPLDYFYLIKSMYEIDDSDFTSRLNDLSTLLNVKELLKVQTRKLSLGEKMKMEFIAATLHKPKVLFLDEPTIGLDFQSQKVIRTFLKEYRKKYSATIILTSHDLNDIKEVCERVIIINKGEIVLDSNLNEIINEFDKNKFIKVKSKHALDLSNFNNYGELISKENDIYTLKINSENLSEAVGKMLKQNSIMDITIEDISLNEIIEKYYNIGVKVNEEVY